MAKKFRAEYSHGGAAVEPSPPLQALSEDTKPVMELTLDQAALLNVAIQSALMQLSEYDLRSAEGRAMRMQLILYGNRLQVFVDKGSGWGN